MAEINMPIHGKNYAVACDGGQERRVADLGRYVDARLREIAGAGAASTEAHLLVLTSLVLADEIYELREALQGLERQMAGMAGELRRREQLDEAAQAQEASEPSDDDEEDIMDAINHLAARIDSVAARLQKI